MSRAPGEERDDSSTNLSGLSGNCRTHTWQFSTEVRRQHEPSMKENGAGVQHCSACQKRWPWHLVFVRQAALYCFSSRWGTHLSNSVQHLEGKLFARAYYLTFSWHKAILDWREFPDWRATGWNTDELTETSTSIAHRCGRDSRH